MNKQPKILGLVERQTKKSYGERKVGKHRIIVKDGQPYVVAKDPLVNTPIFTNTAICLACGKEKHVNTCGFCEECWVTYSHVRERK